MTTTNNLDSPMFPWDNSPSEPACIITCGSRKRGDPRPAAELYTGPLFTACLRDARRRYQDRLIYVISAKHGIVKLDQVIAPYNTKMPKQMSIAWQQLREKVSQQLYETGLVARPEITILAGRTYVELIASAYNKAPGRPRSYDQRRPPTRFIEPIIDMQIGQALHELKIRSQVCFADSRLIGDPTRPT